MLVGVQSDEYIRKNCWEHTAPLDFRKRIGKPIRVQAQGNMRKDITFDIQQPTLLNLATNIVAITPRKNRPANADIVSYVVDSLKKNEEAFVMSHNATYERLESPPYYGNEIMREHRPGETIIGTPQPVTNVVAERERMAAQRSIRASMSSDLSPQQKPRPPRMYTVTAGGMRGGISRIEDYPSPP